MDSSFLPTSTVIFRAAKNVHRFFYFLNNRLYTFVTSEKSYSKQVAALFGALNALVVGSVLLGGTAHALDSNALPTGYQSVSGNVQFNQTGNQLNVTTAANTSVANYQTFNVGSNASVNFDLPSSSSRILNRVVGGSLSEIYGSIQSNGQVFLINPAGVFFANGSSLNMGGFTASTLNITDNDFLSGMLRFSRGADVPLASITVAEGAEITASNGSANFITSSFDNAGAITASGAINVAVGDKVTLGDDLIGFTIDEGLKDALDHAAITNNGSMTAESVKLAAQGVYEATQASIVNTGTVRAAKIVTGDGGEIDFVANSGTVENAGTLDASGASGGSVTVEGDIARNRGVISAVGTHGAGGDIKVLGDKVSISNGSLTDASGQTGGGNINIGGGFQGNDATIRNAEQTAVGDTAVIKADAIASGDGGDVVVWSDEYTRYYGHISAKGGAQSGNGGDIEVSGKAALDFNGSVDTTAANGRVGTLLLDPEDLTVVDAGGTLAALTDADDFADTPATAGTIDVGLINAAGADVTLRANRDLSFNNTGTALNLMGGSLTAEAGQDLTVATGVGVHADNGIFFNAGRSVFNQGAISSTNAPIMLVSGVTLPTTSAPIAAGGIYTYSGSSINSNGGLTTLTSGADINLGVGSTLTSTGGVTMTAETGMTLSGSIDATGGNVSLTNNTSGNINATGTLFGDDLTATVSVGPGTISLFDTDFTNATLTTQGGDIVLFDKDGVALLADTNNLSSSVVDVLAYNLAATADNGVGETDLTLASGATRAGTVNLTVQGAGAITQAIGSTVQGTVLNAFNYGSVGDVTIRKADFSTVSLNNLNGGNLTYQDFDGVSVVASNNSTTVGTVDITTHGLFVTADNGILETDLQMLGLSAGGSVLLVTHDGAITQAVGSTLQGGSLSAINSGGGEVSITNADFESAGLDTTGGGNITYNDKDGIDLVADNASLTAGVISITTHDAAVTADNSNVEADFLLGAGTTRGGEIILLANSGNLTRIAGRIMGTTLDAEATTGTITIDNADFSQATLETTAGANITYVDKDGVSIVADTGSTTVGTVDITTHNAALTADNSNVETNLELFLGSTQAGTVNLTANAGNMTQTIGSELEATDLTATANGVAMQSITLTDIDVETGVFATAGGDTIVGDSDGLTVTATTGSTTNGFVGVTAFSPGLSSNNAAAEANLLITGNNSALNYSLATNSGNIDEIGTTMQGDTLTAINTNLNGTINIDDADFRVASFVTNEGNITYKDNDGIEVSSNTGSFTVGSVEVTAFDAASTSDNTNIEGDLGISGTNQSFTYTLNTSSGNIFQTAGTMQGGILVATNTAAGGGVVMGNADYSGVGLTSNAANIAYVDKDGFVGFANTGSTATSLVELTTFDAGVTADNLGVEANLRLSDGTTQAATVNLTANSGDINQHSTGLLQAGILNATTTLAGGAINLDNVDATFANLTTNTGDITYKDRDGVNVNANTGAVGGGDITIEASTAGVTSNNANAEVGLGLGTGLTQGDNVALIANTGNITQSILGTVLGSGLTITAAADVTLGAANNVDFATYTFNSSGSGNTFTVTDTDNFQVLGITAPITNFSLTASGSGAAVDLNGNPLAPAVDEIDMLVDGVITARNLTLAGNTGSIFLNNNITTTPLGGLTVDTYENLADITQAAGKTISVGGTSFIRTNGSTEATITINGTVNAAGSNNIRTLGSGGVGVGNTITVASGAVVESTGSSVGLLALGEDSHINIHDDVDAFGHVNVDTFGTNADINLNAGADLDSGGFNTILIATAGDSADINLNTGSDVNASGTTVTIQTTGTTGSTITQQSGSVVTAADMLLVQTQGDFGTIDLSGTLTSTNSTVEVSTAGQDATIELGSTGSILANSHATVESSGVNADITIDGSVTSTVANVTLRTNDSDSDIQLNATSVLNAGNEVLVETTVDNSNIGQVAGSTITAANDLYVDTQGATSLIDLAGSLTSTNTLIDVSTTGENSKITVTPTGTLLANTDVTIDTGDTNADIEVNGSVTATTGNVLIQTNLEDSSIELGTTSLVNAGGAATVMTTATTNAPISSIIQLAGSAVTSAGLLSVETQGDTSSINISGSLESTNDVVLVRTIGTTGSGIIVESTASILSDSDTHIATFGANAPIRIAGALASTNGMDVNTQTSSPTSGITQDASSVVGGSTTRNVFYQVLGDADLTLSGSSEATAVLLAGIVGSTGLFTIDSTATLEADPTAGRVYLIADNMDFVPGHTLSANVVQFSTYDTTTSVGVGGGAGTLQLTQNAFNGITANEIMIGQSSSNNLITLGQLDLSAIPANITFNTLDSVQEWTPTDDSGSFNNLFMATNRNAVFTGGAVDYTDAPFVAGVRSVGNDTTVFGDIDISFPGTGEAFVKLPDGLFNGKVIRETTALGEAFINAQGIDNTLRNLAAGLGGRSSFQVINAATQKQLLYELGLSKKSTAEIHDETKTNKH